MGIRLFSAALLAAGFTWNASAQERLRITVQPILIFPNAAAHGTPPPEMYPIGYEGEAIIAVHAAMDRLQVRPHQYDVVVPDNIETMDCAYGSPGLSTFCMAFNEQRGPVFINQFGLEELHKTLGYDSPTGEAPLNDAGEITLLILVKSDRFPWEGVALGRSAVYTLVGWDPALMHWSTTACTAWAHLHVPTIAHELGHCFGLDHNGDPDDKNHNGSDNTFDLMAAPWYYTYPATLRESNQNRVSHHFRDLDAPLATLAAPMSRTFD